MDVLKGKSMAEDYVKLTAEDLAYRWRERTLLEYVDEAIGQAGSTEEYATPRMALRRTLELAWSDLQSARREALNGCWSMLCDSQVYRIIGLTRLVGPCPWENVDVDLILDGIYERIHEAIGTPMPLSDEDRRRVQAVKDRQSAPRGGV